MTDQDPPPKWKLITRSDDYSDCLQRLKVLGGWLYRSSQTSSIEGEMSESMVFVPDQSVRQLLEEEKP